MLGWCIDGKCNDIKGIVTGSIYREEICFESVIFCSTGRTHQYTWYERCPINTSVLLSRLFNSHKALLPSNGQYNSSGLIKKSGCTHCHALSYIESKVFIVTVSYVSDSEICSMTFNILAESLAHLFPLFIRIGNQYNHSSASPFRNQFASHTGKLCMANVTPSIAYAVDVISLAWSGILVYAFPPSCFVFSFF